MTVRVSHRMKGRRYSMDLPAHMAECDANYLRLNKLFPGLKDSESAAIGVELNAARFEVRLDVIERDFTAKQLVTGRSFSELTDRFKGPEQGEPDDPPLSRRPQRRGGGVPGQAALSEGRLRLSQRGHAAPR